MNSQTFMRAIKFTSIFLIAAIPQVGFSEWKVDMSRRQSQVDKPALEESVETKIPEKEKTLFERVFDTSVPVQDIVILNTDQGFVPSTVRVKEGNQYRIVVVNVNEKSRNVSFVLDAFSEHHATFYGKMKSFYISPKKEGVYTFISPETSAQGRLVVHPGTPKNSPAMDTAEVRTPASQ